MKPIDIEHEILLALRSSPIMCIHSIHRRISTAHGEGPGWREVANVVMRLERRRWVYVAGTEQEIHGEWHTAYSLTEVGRGHAEEARQQRDNARGEGEVPA